MPNVEMHDINRGVLPFVAGAVVTLLRYILFPQLALFLPNLMLGK